VPQQGLRSENYQLWIKKKKSFCQLQKQQIDSIIRSSIVRIEKNANVLPPQSMQHQHWENKTFL